MAAYRSALELNPGYAEAHNNLGAALQRQGKLDEAIATYRHALDLKPDYPAVHNDIGNVLRELGQLDEAIASYRQALTIKPDFAEAHINLGNALQQLGQLDEAVASYRQALSVEPDFAEAHSNLGNVLRELGQLDEAIASYRQALTIKPDFAEAHSNLGNALQELGQLCDAVAALHRALELDPNYPEAHYNLGNALGEQGKLDDAIVHYHRALELKADYPKALINLGRLFREQGMFDEALASYRRALELKPDDVVAHSNLLFCLNFLSAYDRAKIFAEHRCWGEQHAGSLRVAAKAPLNSTDPERWLRIGYVSPDLRDHSVAYFFEALLAAHDPAVVVTHCYADVPRPDRITARLRSLSSEWHSIFGMSDERVAEQVRGDGIDILVDLAGHTANNRLLVFARKPAPVQVSYIGYCNTTGLDTIDYLLTDALVDPEGQNAFYSEELVRLTRCFVCYTPVADAPPVGPLPAGEAGCITFGAFNNLAKVTPEVVALWSRILLAVPGARLVLKARSLGDAATRERYAALFLENGIAHDRIDLVERIRSKLGHLALYGKIDIGLDTLPYNGTTTTCETLWMGVPVITLAGRAHAGRVGVSLLTAVGLEELIAETPDDYVALATRLAGDLDRLSALRTDLRSRMAASPLCDQAGLALAVESAYRTMWRRWCQRPDAPSNTPP